MKVLIIIPAYNEEENIVRVVDTLKKEYPQYDYVVVNDGSTDRTAEICHERRYSCIDLPVNLGLAGAFQTGMKYALKCGYDCAVQYDGDGQHRPEYIAGMIELLEREKLDIVIGSRYIKEKKPFNLRMMGNTLIEFCIYCTTGNILKDTTSGMRMFNRRMIYKLATSVNCGPEPDTVAYLMRCGAKVKEYPVTMNERIAGTSYLSMSRATKYMVHMCLSILVVQWFRKREL